MAIILSDSQGSGGTAGAGKGLNFVGAHAFAFSGVIQAGASTSADVTYLNFKTGNFYLIGTMQCGFESSGGNDHFSEVRFNDIPVIKATVDAAPDMAYLMPFEILIPPYTQVEVKWGIGNVTVGCTWWFTGRVYR